MNKEKVIGLLAGVLGYIDGNLTGKKKNKALEAVRSQVQRAYDELTSVNGTLQVVETIPKVIGPDPLAERRFQAKDFSKKAFDSGANGAMQVEDLSGKISNVQTVVTSVKRT